MLIVDKTSAPTKGDMVVALIDAEMVAKEWRIMDGQPFLAGHGDSKAVRFGEDVDMIRVVVEMRRRKP